MTAGGRGWRIGLGLLWATYLAFVLWGVAQVPFHPDESTYLYMSRDFELLFGQGQLGAVTWQAPGQPADVIRYRLMDAPLARYLVGLGRALLGYAGQPLAHDWDWSATWEANVANGALPAPGLLQAARLPAAVLTGLSPLLVFGIGRRMNGPLTGLGAALLYALNGLVLLHGRRAMSEGPLLFALLLVMWLGVANARRPALSGLGAALAIAAKLTGVAALPVALVSSLWPATATSAGEARHSTGKLMRDLATFGAAFVLAAAALSPALWASPLAGLQAMAAARAGFNQGQAALLGQLAPNQLLRTPGQRALAMVYHVFYAPLAFWDVPNYQAATRASEEQYLALPLHTGLHTPSLTANLFSGSALLALALAGLLLASAAWATPARSAATAPQRRALALLALWSLASAATLLAIAVPWQRYYIGLVPIACLWAAYGLAGLLRPIRRLLAERAAGSGMTPSAPMDSSA